MKFMRIPLEPIEKPLRKIGLTDAVGRGWIRLAEARTRKMLLIEGLIKLKTGALLAIIGSMLLAITIIMGIILSPSLASLGFLSASGLLSSARFLLGELGISIYVLLGIGILGLILGIAAFALWFSATGSLKEFDRLKLGIGRTGMKLQLAGAILLIIAILVAILGAILLAPLVIVGALVLVIIGGILALIGIVFFSIMLMSLAEIEGIEEGFKIAGILYALMVIPVTGIFLGFVAVIMIYVYSKRSIEALISAG